MMTDLTQFGRMLLGVGGVLIRVGILFIAIGRVLSSGAYQASSSSRAARPPASSPSLPRSS